MVTAQQLVKKARKVKLKFNKTPTLKGNPQKKGICVRAFTKNPRKPNSARRRVCQLRFRKEKKKIVAYIPGIGHSLQEYSIVLLRGGRAQDLPGVKYRLIRGKFDLIGVYGRKTARSKYGLPKETE